MAFAIDECEGFSKAFDQVTRVDGLIPSRDDSLVFERIELGSLGATSHVPRPVSQSRAEHFGDAMLGGDRADSVEHKERSPESFGRGCRTDC